MRTKFLRLALPVTAFCLLQATAFGAPLKFNVRCGMESAPVQMALDPDPRQNISCKLVQQNPNHPEQGGPELTLLRPSAFTFGTQTYSAQGWAAQVGDSKIGGPIDFFNSESCQAAEDALYSQMDFSLSFSDPVIADLPGTKSNIWVHLRLAKGEVTVASAITGQECFGLLEK